RRWNSGQRNHRRHSANSDWLSLQLLWVQASQGTCVPGRLLCYWRACSVRRVQDTCAARGRKGPTGLVSGHCRCVWSYWRRTGVVLLQRRHCAGWCPGWLCPGYMDLGYEIWRRYSLGRWSHHFYCCNDHRRNARCAVLEEPSHYRAVQHLGLVRAVCRHRLLCQDRLPVHGVGLPQHAGCGLRDVAKGLCDDCRHGCFGPPGHYLPVCASAQKQGQGKPLRRSAL
ncbi:hypothetical protein LPJ57_011130, partial [Coemansia sp. RSA 486]